MDIHTMMANAAADIRSMEMRTEALARELKASNADNERLRQENAKITAARMHAEADLTHYQNVFVASVCIEAGNICKEFFNATHEKVRERAEGAIQRFVEEKVDKEREASGVFEDTHEDKDNFDEANERELAESAIRPYINSTDDPEGFREFDKSISEPSPETQQAQAPRVIVSEDLGFIKPPAGCSWREAKMFWSRNCTLPRPLNANDVYKGFLPQYLTKNSLLRPEPIPSFLTEPKEPPKFTLPSLLATVGL